MVKFIEIPYHLQDGYRIVTFQNVSAEGPLILAGDGYHTGREIGKYAEQSHDGPGGEPAEETGSQVTSEELHLRIGGLH